MCSLWHNGLTAECQSCFLIRLFDLSRLCVAEGWGRFWTKVLIDAWVWWLVVSFGFGDWCIPSFWICCSIAPIPSFFLLRIFAFTFPWIHFALAPLARSRFWAIVFGVTYILRVQYSCAVVSVFLLWRESYSCTNTLQSRSFLKNIENFLCKKNDSI